MVSTINEGIIPFRYTCIQLLFLNGTLNCEQARSSEENETTLRPAAGSPGQRRGGIRLPLQTKVVRAPSAVEVVTTQNISSFDWRTLADTLQSHARLARP
jgi:hypothetical protein